MTDPSLEIVAQPILTSVAPHLFVAAILSSCDFFTGKLGFVVDFVYGDPPFYMDKSAGIMRCLLCGMSTTPSLFRGSESAKILFRPRSH
jgi:hypothetical protein